MVDATAVGPVPNSIGTARSSLAAALQLLDNTRYRKKQLEVLTRRCDDAVQQYMNCVEHRPPEAFADVEDGLKEVEECVFPSIKDLRLTVLGRSCEFVKSILENVNEKGFLWCLMNSDKLDKQISNCEVKLENAFLGLHVRMFRSLENDIIDCPLRTWRSVTGYNSSLVQETVIEMNCRRT